MKNKKALMGLAVATLLLTGCGGKDPVKSSGNTPDKTSETNTSAVVGTSEAGGTSQAGGETTSSKPKTSTAPVSNRKHTVKIGDGAAEEVSEGTALTKPADPEAPAGQAFYGWKNVENGGQIWDFEREDLNKVMQDVTLEPLFVPADMDPQIFEAELCHDITDVYGGELGMPGATYSGGQQGKGLIGRDFYDEYGVTGFDEDNLAFVHFMYVKGDTLTWELDLENDVDNVTILARFGAEYGVTNPENDEVWARVTQDSFPITVNDKKLEYGTITLHNIPEIGQFLSFQDYFLSASVSLHAGRNVIQMKVDNMDTLNGTIASSAPCVDSIKLFSSEEIMWNTAVLENLERD
ncbi:MAG: hypothetical protein MJ241_03570 [Bacilli bacterium]|nr:hypothetical protein [Bacilli bacterium]